jgi:hypothetical protein
MGGTQLLIVGELIDEVRADLCDDVQQQIFLRREVPQQCCVGDPESAGHIPQRQVTYSVVEHIFGSGGQ